MTTRSIEAVHTAKQPRVNRRLSLETLAAQNRRYRHTGSVSQANRAYGFLPAFMDSRSGAVYLSRFADGRLAPIHLIKGLPENLIATRTRSGTVTAASGSVIAGFVREGRFYTREEAAKALH